MLLVLGWPGSAREPEKAAALSVFMNPIVRLVTAFLKR
jgi:hypothetical protein